MTVFLLKLYPECEELRMRDDQLARAKELIQANRYQEAKQLLEQINHPTAKRWLEKVNAHLASVEHTVYNIPAPPSTPAYGLQKPSTPQEIIVTTTDLQYPYRVIAPIYFQTSNKGLFSSTLGKLKQKYKEEIEAMKRQGTISRPQLDLGFIWYGEFSIGQNDFEAAFYVSVREMQNRAWQMKADAIVGMRQDIDLDTSGWQFFYLQMYGTAIRYI